MYMHVHTMVINCHYYSTSGFVCNGEFNYLRAKGYTRPLSVLQIRAEVRAKYSKMSQRMMKAMLTPKSKCRSTGILVLTYMLFNVLELELLRVYVLTQQSHLLCFKRYGPGCKRVFVSQILLLVCVHEQFQVDIHFTHGHQVSICGMREYNKLKYPFFSRKI